MTIETKYGLIIGVLGFAWLILEYATGLQSTYIEYHPYVTNLAILIPVVAIWFGLKEKKQEDYGGRMTYVEGFKAGLMISLVAGILAVGFQWLFHNAVNPGYLELLTEMLKERYAAAGKTEEEALNAASALYTPQLYMMQAGLGALFFGIVITALQMLILRSK